MWWNLPTKHVFAHKYIVDSTTRQCRIWSHHCICVTWAKSQCSKCNVYKLVVKYAGWRHRSTWIWIMFTLPNNEIIIGNDTSLTTESNSSRKLMNSRPNLHKLGKQWLQKPTWVADTWVQMANGNGRLNNNKTWRMVEAGSVYVTRSIFFF